MSDEDKLNNGTLVRAGHRDLAPVTAANPLVSRGIADLNKAICSKDAGFYFDRGVEWFDSQAYDEAMKDFDKAIQINPKSAWAYRYRAKVWQISGFYGKAKKDFSEAIRVDPTNARLYYERGECGRHEFALEDLDEAIRLDPKFADAYYERYHVCHYAAYEIFNRLRWAKDRDEEIRYCDDLIKRCNDAISDFEEANRLDPELASRVRNETFFRAYYMRGIAFSAKKDYDNAIKDFDEALRLNPKCDAYKERALAWSAKQERV
jgi:tetratricopeptide (TPR) repeat protein